MRLPSLTGLRWMGALLVFACHTRAFDVLADQDWLSAWNVLTGRAIYGVSFFFVLSGFVLAWSADPAEPKMRFWLRRLARIGPGHAATWLVVLLVGALAFGDQVRPLVAAANLALVQSWVPDMHVYYSVNTVSWSLACEAFFYLCLPFALPVIRRMRSRTLWLGVLALPALMCLAYQATKVLPVDPWWFVQIFPPVRSLEFWLGVVVAELVRRGHWRGPGLRKASAAVVVMYFVGALLPYGLWAASLAVPFVLLVAAAAQADVDGLASRWRSARMQKLGELSFAFYLVHLPLIFNAKRIVLAVWGQTWQPWQALLTVPVLLVVSLAVAWPLHRYVEVPVVRWMSRRNRAPSAPAGLPAAV